jgi:hypothetical protein
MTIYTKLFTGSLPLQLNPLLTMTITLINLNQDLTRTFVYVNEPPKQIDDEDRN